MALDNFRKVNITLNKANQRVLETQIAKVGDANGRELVVQITNNGVIENQTGTTLKLNWQHENGKQGSTTFNVVDIETGRFSVYYPMEMLYKGKVNASIEITSNGQITNSMNFKIIVQADVFDGEAGNVDGVFISLAEVNKKLDDREAEYEELKSRQTTIETQFNSVQQELTDKDVISAPEIIAARNGEANLKSRLDKDQQEVNAQLAQTTKNLNSRINVLVPPPPLVGAKGDNINDDTDAINAILTNYKNVYFPDPVVNYRITAPLKVRDSQQLVGDGVLTMIKGYGTFDSMIQSVNNGGNEAVITQLRIENLYLLGDSSSNIKYGLDLKEIAYSTIKTITTNNFKEAGIRLYNISASYNAIYDVITKNCKDGIRLEYNANSTRIYNPTCTGNSRNGIRIDGGGRLSVQTCGIFSGSMESNGDSAIWVDGRGCMIQNVHIEGNAYETDNYGIDGVGSTAIFDNTITGCYFYRNGNDTEHTKHVRGVPDDEEPLAVFSFLHPTLNKYIIDSGYYGGTSTQIGFEDRVAMFPDDGELVLQTSGAGKAVNVKGSGGFNVPLKLGGGMIIDPRGLFSNAYNKYYEFDFALRFKPLDTSVAPPPINSFFVDSSDNVLKFKNNAGVIKTVTLT